MKRRITQEQIFKGSVRFKSSLLELKKYLQNTLPTVAEGDEYTNTVSPSLEKKLPERTHVGKFEGKTLAEHFAEMKEFDFDHSPNYFKSKPIPAEPAETNRLAEEFAQMGFFDFSKEKNYFRSVGESSKPIHPEYSQAPIYSPSKFESNPVVKIVDFVPSTIPVSKQQMLKNFSGKILEENYKATKQLNIHNEIALQKLLSTLERFICDEKNIPIMDSLDSKQSYLVFKNFCEELGLSSFRDGYEEL